MSRENEALLQANGFFDRICDALDVKNERGAKARIAEIVDVSDNAIGFWEKGEMPGKKSLENIAKIAKRSNTSIHWLLTGEGEKFVNTVKTINLDETFRAVVREIVREEFLENSDLHEKIQGIILATQSNVGKFEAIKTSSRKEKKAG